jgi:ribosome-associated toxin RatA of RatAB toxin-antitoxin module
MPRIHREAIVPYSCAQMFSLVNDVKRYPEFLPGCAAAEILQLESQAMKARLTLSKSAFRHAFVTQNRWLENERIDMQLAEGPFKQLQGQWQFIALGEACKVTVSIDFEFSSLLGSMAFSAAFQRLVASLMDAFVQRAQVIYHHE